MIDFYQILQVSRNADNKEIERNYKRLVIKSHPAYNKGTESIFSQVTEAYGVLSNKDERFLYNLIGHGGYLLFETTHAFSFAASVVDQTNFVVFVFGVIFFLILFFMFPVLVTFKSLKVIEFPMSVFCIFLVPVCFCVVFILYRVILKLKFRYQILYNSVIDLWLQILTVVLSTAQVILILLKIDGIFSLKLAYLFWPIKIWSVVIFVGKVLQHRRLKCVVSFSVVQDCVILPLYIFVSIFVFEVLQYSHFSFFIFGVSTGLTLIFLYRLDDLFVVFGVLFFVTAYVVGCFTFDKIYITVFCKLVLLVPFSFVVAVFVVGYDLMKVSERSSVGKFDFTKHPIFSSFVKNTRYVIE